jgi:hypothetical protein
VEEVGDDSNNTAARTKAVEAKRVVHRTNDTFAGRANQTAPQFFPDNNV